MQQKKISFNSLGLNSVPLFDEGKFGHLVGEVSATFSGCDLCMVSALIYVCSCIKGLCRVLLPKIQLLQCFEDHLSPLCKK